VRAALFLAFAAVAAVAAAVVFTRYVERRTAAARVPTAKVVVAAMDLPPATTLRIEALSAVDWPLHSRPAGTAAEPRELAGRVVVVPLVKGEPVLAGKLAGADAGGGLAAVLPHGMRAAAVRIDDVVGVAGFIRPGDHVDVIVTMKPTDGVQVPPISKVILQGIRVLAVGKEVAAKGKEGAHPIPATVATLMVSSDESEKLALAATKGQILLTLRPAVDDEIVETSGIVPPELLGRPPRAAPAPPPRSAPRPASRPPPQARPVPVAAPAPPPPSSREHAVEILRGDLFEKRGFQDAGGKP
jgi:pilus assembly protein CpaB